MEEQDDFFFKIDDQIPGGVSAERLAEYMKDLAKLFDSDQHVHAVSFTSVGGEVAMKVDRARKEELKQRVCDAGQEKGRHRSVAAFRRINERLYEDGKEGWLFCDGATLLHFLGKQLSPETEISPFKQEGSFDGRVIRVGGQESLVPVWLQSGNDKIQCLANHNMAKKLAEHLFGKELRVFGTGKRFCDEKGEWKFSRFLITNFEVLDTTPLTVLVERLRSIPGNGWEKIENPWERLKQERED